MGKLKMIKLGPLTTLQDFGRFGYRRFGIPQSGAMDKEWMIVANTLVGNPMDWPVLEFAMRGLKFEVLEEVKISVVGASICVNGKSLNEKAFSLKMGDQVEVSSPKHVYGYLGISGRIRAKEDFGSVSTYLMAGFGGLDGRAVRAGDIIESDGAGMETKERKIPPRDTQGIAAIRIMKGPEWGLLKELPDALVFEVDASSNRMGIRLNGKLACDFREIASSAVVPGTIQLPANGEPIVLMNDCQTTGGYPRIGKVLDEDLGKLAQLKSGAKISFISS
ncbi:MAG: biotin-dependent carboxyltransferase family protein [Ekhidna sp.]